MCGQASDSAQQFGAKGGTEARELVVGASEDECLHAIECALTELFLHGWEILTRVTYPLIKPTY